MKIPHKVRAMPAKRKPAEPLLAPRQAEILLLMSHGETDGEIAAKLGIMPSTVRSATRYAMQRLSAKTREQAIAEALRMREFT